MKPTTTAMIARLAAKLLCIVLMAVAFLRGKYLLGFQVGVAYAFVAGILFWIFAESFRRRGRVSLMQIITIALASLPVGFVMAFPAVVSPDVQHFIDKHATDRTVRAELKHVFGSDPAFRELSISTTHLKVVNITIHGALPARRDLNRLRERAINECPNLKRCPLHWDVTLRGTREQIEGLDRDLFPSVDDTA